MNLLGNRSPIVKLASIFGQSGSRRKTVVEASCRSIPCQTLRPATPEEDWDEITVSLFHLDQHTGFDNNGTTPDIHAINDLVEQICSTSNGASLHRAQSSWLCLYIAHDLSAVPAEHQDAQLDQLEANAVNQPGEKWGINSAMTENDASADETAVAANEVETASADLEADATEIQIISLEDAAGASDTKDSSMETRVTEPIAEIDLAGSKTGEAGRCAASTAEAPTSKPPTALASNESIVELVDFDPERDVIGVFYAKSIDAVTGKPVTPKVRVSDNSDGTGHIISLDGCDVARVIGAEGLAEHQVKLIAE